MKPQIQTKASAGADLVAAEDVFLPKGGMAIVSTGYMYDIAETAFVRGRSGLAFNHGITAYEGTIDAGYRGEVKVLLFNHRQRDMTIIKGTRIAQLVVLDVKTAEYFETVDKDRTGGFGSTNP